MRILALVALFALLTGPAYAQGMNLLGDTPKDPVREQKREENERAYNAARQKIPDQKVIANDPWGNMRSTPEAKTVTAKPKPPAR
jgi:hypothetical protein